VEGGLLAFVWKGYAVLVEMIAVLYGRRTAVFCGSKTDGCSV
jgi:hypothetical protein